ncbi:MAG: transporter [Planctomycetota bacterium]
MGGWWRSRSQYLLLLIACSPSIAHAEGIEFLDDFGKPFHCQRNPYEERMETDRHDFTQSAYTVGRGVWQAEGGFSFFYKDTHEGVERAYTFPEMLLRIGLSEDIEFRIRTDYVWLFITNEEDEKGAEDFRYSFKLQVTRQEEAEQEEEEEAEAKQRRQSRWIPTSVLEIRGTAPTGGADFSTGNAEFGLDYIYEWRLNEETTFAASTGWVTDGFGDFGLVADEPRDESFNVFTQSAVVGAEISEDNAIYLEWFGLFSDGLEDEYVVSTFNIGVDHYLNKNVVVDIRFGVGLSRDSDDFFTGIGGGYRY